MDYLIPVIKRRSTTKNFQGSFGIPSGGVITGADIPKPPEWTDIFGGKNFTDTAPCYFQLCDNVENARTDVTTEIAGGYAHILWTYANIDEIIAEEPITTLPPVALGLYCVLSRKSKQLLNGYVVLSACPEYVDVSNKDLNPIIALQALDNIVLLALASITSVLPIMLLIIILHPLSLRSVALN